LGSGYFSPTSIFCDLAAVLVFYKYRQMLVMVLLPTEQLLAT
jgi:hypothetical protein